jgi:cytochrome P450 RapN
MPKVRMTYGQPAWLATRYEDVKTVLGDSRFSRAAAVGPDEPRVLPFVQRSDSIFTTDGADHNRLRKAVAMAFTPRRVEQLQPFIQATADGLLDELEAAGPPADLVRGLSLPMSIQVICTLLGVPYEDRDRFRAWADIILVNSADAGVRPEQIVQAQQDLRDFLGELVGERRESPADDLLGVLVEAGDEEGKLTDDEIVGLGVDVLIAGHETTTNFIGNLTYLMITSGTYSWLRDHPPSLPQAIEELLRLVPLGANAFMARVATEDVPLGGVVVRAGEAVLPAMASANQDETVFENASQPTFVDRPVRHLTFGHGPHHCLGAQLGRTELRIAIGALLRRFPNLELAVPAEEVGWRSTMLIRGPWALPVRW